MVNIYTMPKYDMKIITLQVIYVVFEFLNIILVLYLYVKLYILGDWSPDI